MRYRYLSAQGIADSAWVGAGRQDPVPIWWFGIHGDRQAAGVEFVIRPAHDVVAAAAQASADLVAEAALQRRAGWHLQVGVKRVRPGERRKSRRLDGLLCCHAEDGDVQESLQHRL